MPADPVKVIARALKREAGPIMPWEGAQAFARTALAALKEEGMAVVPVEPSEAMVHAGAAAHDYPNLYMGGPSYHGRRMAKRVWETMVLMHEERPLPRPPLRMSDPVEGWQPIETAPMDGSAVLVHRNIWPGTRSGLSEECNGHNTYVAEWWPSEDGGEWVCYMDLPSEPRLPIEPTHWQPLPRPPRLSDVGEPR